MLHDIKFCYFHVENFIIPSLVNAAREGAYRLKVDISKRDIDWHDVQDELCKRVTCRLSGYGKIFTVFWN